MRWPDKLRLRLRSLFKRQPVDQELDRELQFHIDQQIEENLARGMSPEEARFAALGAMGGVTLIREQCRDKRGLNLLDETRQDLRYAFRTFAKNPGFVIVAVLTLALGIGVNTAMFSFVDSVLFKSLDYRNANELVEMLEASPGGSSNPSPPTYLEWKTLNTVFTHVSAYGKTVSLNLTGGNRAERIQGRYVSADYFDMLEVQPVLGRSFREGEDQIGNDRVVVLSNRYWRTRFGGDPGVVGTDVIFDQAPYTVVGVLPAGGVFDRADNDVWIPLTIQPDQMRRNTQFFNVRARLKPGITMKQASQEMQRLVSRLEESQPDRKGYGVALEPLRKPASGDLKQAMLILMGAVLFILLIAGVNVADLLLVRAVKRRKEIVVRVAIGAGKGRLIRQLLTESVLLSLAGGLAGLWIARMLVDTLAVLAPRGIVSDEVPVTLDFRVLLFTLSLSLLTGILFGLVPAWQATRINLTGTLQEHTAGLSARSSYLQSRVLLISEIALTFMLVAGATLMIRSLDRLLSVDPGFQSENLLTFKAAPALQKYPHAADLVRYEDDLLSRVRALPEVEAASVTDTLPIGDHGYGNSFKVVGNPNINPQHRPALLHAVQPDYFAAMGMRLLKGRLITERDMAATQHAIVVNQALARRYFSDTDPVGSFIDISGLDSFEIVGVAADVKQNGLSRNVPDEIYLPLAHLSESGFNFFGRTLIFVIRTTGDPDKLAGSVQDIARNVDKDLPVFAIKTMNQVIQDSVAQPKFQTILFGIFGALALTLATVGVFGVMAYSAAQRTQEIGIRMALGAKPRDIFKAIISQGMTLAVIGIAVGFAGSLALTRLLSSLLFGITATDAVTFAVTSLVVLFVACLACVIPARRAMKIDPLLAIRHE